MRSNTVSLIQVHVAVLLFGMAGLFADWVNQSAIILVLGRVVFGAIALGLILFFRKQDIRLKSREDYIRLLITGIILAVHWTTFFQSIKVAGVAVGLIAYATFPVFVTFLEPIVFKQRLRGIDVMVALITAFGAVLIIEKFELQNNVTQGFLWGVTSAFTFALLSIVNKQNVERYSNLIVALYQFIVAAVVLSPVIFIEQPAIGIRDVALLILLGVVFTAAAHSLYIQGLSGIRAQVAGIIASLESVYGIIFALVLLGQVPSLRTVIGGVIVLGAAAYSSLQSNANKPEKKEAAV